MGINLGSKLLFTLGGLTFAQLVSLCRKWAKDAGQMGGTSCHRRHLMALLQTPKKQHHKHDNQCQRTLF